MTESEKLAISKIQQVTGLVGGTFVVVDGQSTRFECFGYADKAARRPISENTIFDIASNSKAFTAMLGAIAVDEGKFDWDAPVRKYYPDFAMVDEYAATHMTGRDLACHRSGLARHEFMRARVYTSIEDMAYRTRFMEMAFGFREKYRYNNHMFIVLGHIMERVYKKPWQQIILDRIATPLNMEMCFRGRDCCFDGLDNALPYRVDGNGGTFRCEYADNHVAGPCGGVRTNLIGITAWLKCLMAGGSPICSKQSLDALFMPNMPSESEPPRELMCGYGMGWRTSAYWGKRLVYHGGAIGGFQSHIAFFPEENKGIAIMLNTSSTWGANLIRNILLDQLCGKQPDIIEIDAELEKWKASSIGNKALLESVKNGTMPNEKDFSWLFGTFYNPAYDDFIISNKDDDVWLDYGIFHAKVRKLQDGTIIACEDDINPDYMKLKQKEGGLMVETSDLAMWLPFERK